MHALSYGTPVVTHDDLDFQGPECEAIIHGKTGILFKRDSLDDMIKTIEDWIHDGRSREQVRLDCQAVIDQYYNTDYMVKVLNDAVRGISVKNLIDKAT